MDWAYRGRADRSCAVPGVLALMEIGVEAVEVAGDGEDLGDGGELVPAARVCHFPTEPIYAGGHRESRDVVGRGRQTREGSCQRVDFIPPGIIAHGHGLMHVREACGVDAGTQEDKSSFRRRCWREPF